MAYALIAAVVLGAASTLGDMLWAGLSLRQRVVSGLIHGAIVCLFIGAFVGWRARRLASGIAAGPVIGFLAAGVFYLLAPWLRYYAMFPAWMFFWLCFALLQKRLQGEGSWAQAAVRGLIAAVVAGVAFYAVSGVWTSPSREAPRYLYHFGAWSVAFLPGFAALFVRVPARDVAGRTP